MLDNSMNSEKYKKLIIKIALILSTISILISLIAILVVKLFPQDQDGSYEELNISIEENTMPKTFVCIRNVTMNSSNKEKDKNIDPQNNVIPSTNNKDNSLEEGQAQKETDNEPNLANDQNDVDTNSPKAIKVVVVD
ncbi:conserved Plasmodium protein, unknown function [Plasmodium vinckei vinckei]|uniref:Uncharacterized protein n=1 Tax=Plasmodium vinckei vinckei TaxID=54757 RepID=A0A449BY82_PLAVN|nr:conserved Plasmodium protein, unknown function [Plasmodium vinckei vinckei]KEG04797.1 hypothetical protein YYE_00372 [Plasmodium vinckei vinckei]VEV58450.1 conserved Plasmodium protein, unknown function [Plasmodium vinckei vinckei]